MKQTLLTALFMGTATLSFSQSGSAAIPSVGSAIAPTAWSQNVSKQVTSTPPAFQVGSREPMILAAGPRDRVDRRQDHRQNAGDRVDDKQDHREDRRDCTGNGADCRSDNRQDNRSDTADRANDRVDDRQERR